MDQDPQLLRHKNGKGRLWVLNYFGTDIVLRKLHSLDSFYKYHDFMPAGWSFPAICSVPATTWPSNPIIALFQFRPQRTRFVVIVEDARLTGPCPASFVVIADDSLRCRSQRARFAVFVDGVLLPGFFSAILAGFVEDAVLQAFARQPCRVC